MVEEWLALEQDRRTLRTIRFPSSQEVKILWNRIEVPKQGLASRVEIKGREQGPFEIDATTNVVSISVDGGLIQNVTLPQGNSVRAETIARILNEQLRDVVVGTSRGYLTLSLETTGPESSLKMEGGTAHGVLGLASERVYQGKLVVPGWSLLKDTDRGDDPLARKIVFDEPLKTEDDDFEVSYYTLKGVCRRCMGLGIENDFRYDVRGEPVFVQNQQLLLQEVEKIIFTIKGSNIFHRWYGTNLANLVGSKIVGGGNIIESQLVSEISSSIGRYQEIKDRQAKVQPVTRGERLDKVVSIDVEQGRDPTVFFVNIVLQSRSGQIETLDEELVISDASFADGFQLAR